MQSELRAINEMVLAESGFVDRIAAEIGKVIVGQRQMIDRILVGLLTGGHVLLEGVPGLAKTLTVNTVATTMSLTFSRIQFTPDLLPADIIGTTIFNPQSSEFSAKKGPVFANIVLADEINRAPAKVQSALLEAMQEGQVTIGDHTHELPNPFWVLATQNPIEQEGTYPLPEAQIDRFMLLVRVGYPSRDEERQIMDRMTSRAAPAADQIIGVDELRQARDVVHQVYVDDKIKDYIIDLVSATREPQRYGLAEIAEFIQFGASPRASIFLNLAAKAHAFLQHRGFVTPEDIKSIGADVLRHRVLVTYEAEAEDVSSEDIVRRLFEQVEVP